MRSKAEKKKKPKKKPTKQQVMAFIRFAIDDVYATDFFGICLQMAFYFLLAFFPMMMFLIGSIGGFLSEFKVYFFAFLKSLLPVLSYNYVVDLFVQLQHSSSNLAAMLVITFFFASMAARAIMVGINQNYGNPETRSTLHIWLLAFLFTILFAVVLVLITAIYFVMDSMTASLLERTGLVAFNVPITQGMAVIFSLVASPFILDFIYILAPVERLPYRQGLPGAIFTTLGINIVVRIFTFFVNHSSKYTLLYGNLGGLFALLISIYFICVILNIGTKINLYLRLLKQKKLPMQQPDT